MNRVELWTRIFGATMTILLLCLALYTAASIATAASGNATVSCDSGTQPTVDGVISPGEYADANTAVIQMAGGQTGTVYFKYFGTTVYVACTETYWFETFWDLNNDGASLPQTDDYLLHTCAAIFEHRGVGNGWGAQNNNINGWSTVVNSDSEQAISFNKLGITPGTAKTLGVMFLCYDYGDNQDKMWPAGGSLNNPSTWGNINSPSNWGESNLPPEVTSPPSDINFNEDTTNNQIDLNNVFTDPESNPLSFSHSVGGVSKDNIQVSISSGIVTLTPDPDFNGQEIITFTASDGNNPAVSTDVTVTVNAVNDAPAAVMNNLDFTMDEDQAAQNKYDLTGLFSDVDTDTELNAVPQAALTHTYTSSDNIDVSVVNNMVSFTPAENWFGEETFTFTASDGYASANKDIRVTVNSVKDAPVCNSPISDKEMSEDPSGSDVEFNAVDLNSVFSDADGDELVFSVSGNENVIADIDNSGVLRLTPKENWHGEEVLTVSASDRTSTAAATDEFRVTVNSVNDAPDVEPVEDWTIKQDSEHTYTFEAADVDGEVLEYSLKVTGLKAGDYDLDQDTGELAFTPENALVGTYDAELSVADLSGETVKQTFKITVENVNDAPEAGIVSPADNSNYKESETVTLVGECTDADLDIDVKENIVYLWESDLDGELGFGPKLNDVKLNPGTHKVTLTTTDKAGLFDTASILVVVKAEQTPVDVKEEEDDKDTDGDGLEDAWEILHFGDLSRDAQGDADGDGISNLKEYQAGTNPNDVRTETNKRSSGSGMLLPAIMITVIVLLIVAGTLVVVLLLVVKSRKKTTAIPEPSARADTPPGPPEQNTPPPQPPSNGWDQYRMTNQQQNNEWQY